MRITIAIGLIAAAVLGFASAAAAGPDLLPSRAGHAARNYTPVPKLLLAACQFWQCNCRNECVIYDGSRCVQSVRTCDTCSKCDD